MRHQTLDYLPPRSVSLPKTSEPRRGFCAGRLPWGCPKVVPEERARGRETEGQQLLIPAQPPSSPTPTSTSGAGAGSPRKGLTASPAVREGTGLDHFPCCCLHLSFPEWFCRSGVGRKGKEEGRRAEGGVWEEEGKKSETARGRERCHCL